MTRQGLTFFEVSFNCASKKDAETLEIIADYMDSLGFKGSADMIRDHTASWFKPMWRGSTFEHELFFQGDVIGVIVQFESVGGNYWASFLSVFNRNYPKKLRRHFRLKTFSNTEDVEVMKRSVEDWFRSPDLDVIPKSKRSHVEDWLESLRSSS